MGKPADHFRGDAAELGDRLPGQPDRLAGDRGTGVFERGVREWERGNRGEHALDRGGEDQPGIHPGDRTGDPVQHAGVPGGVDELQRALDHGQDPGGDRADQRICGGWVRAQRGEHVLHPGCADGEEFCEPGIFQRDPENAGGFPAPDDPKFSAGKFAAGDDREYHWRGDFCGGGLLVHFPQE